METFYTAKINDELEKSYVSMFGNCNYGIPHLPEDVAHDSEFLEKAVKKCIDSNKPMEFYYKEYYPERYEMYVQDSFGMIEALKNIQ